LACACIDIGSNTTRLLVAEPGTDGLREIAQERAFTRLGRGLAEGGAVPAGKVTELVAVVAAQTRRARTLGADPVRAVATAALRRAANGAEVLAAVRREAGVAVDLLSEDEEARLAFAGATAALDPGSTGWVGVVDVGGGSTEIVCGTPAAGVSWSRSFRAGSGDLAERHLRSDPPTAAELAAVRSEAADALAGVTAPPVDLALAVGGSATSLCRLVGPALDREALERAIVALTAGPADAVARKADLDPERVRLLPAGIAILAAASAVLSGPLRIARGGLREGVLLELIATQEAAA
jgi:exopolyphosphatase/guanosine-5'-triphosphate,3'-diphosphate pyrophosphatase